jgi:hypothetical protein
LTGAVNAFVMEDEARHVAFGRLALREYYTQLGAAERREREDFVIEACRRLRDRLTGEELWDVVGLPKRACMEYAEQSETMRGFRQRLFSRIVPTVREIGLLGPRVMKAFVEMDVLSFAQVDLGALLQSDVTAAGAYDAASRAE